MRKSAETLEEKHLGVNQNKVCIYCIYWRILLRKFWISYLEIELKATLQKLRIAFEVESIQTAVAIIQL